MRYYILYKIVTDYLSYFQENFTHVPGISDQSVKERLELTYKCKAIFAFLPTANEDMDNIWNLTPEGKEMRLKYSSGMSMNIGGRKFVTYNCSPELNRLLYMLYGKGAPICDIYNCRGARTVFVGYPDNELYKVDGIYDCAENQLMYDSANYLITREGHVGMHIKTDAAISLKNQVEQSMQRRENASDLLKGL